MEAWSREAVFIGQYSYGQSVAALSSYVWLTTLRSADPDERISMNPAIAIESSNRKATW